MIGIVPGLLVAVVLDLLAPTPPGTGAPAPQSTPQGVFVEAREAGQGVLRARGTECFVITPFHVVETAAGPIRVVADRAAQATAELVRQLPGDLAVLRVQDGASLPCRPWPPADAVAETMKNATSGTLVMREADGSRTLVPVTFRGIDDEAIYVRPSQADDQIQKSMSGGSLLVDGTLVGMLLSSEAGNGTVYQIDDIMRVSEGFFATDAAAATGSPLDAYVGDYDFGGLIMSVANAPAGLTLLSPGAPVQSLTQAGDRRFTIAGNAATTAEFRLADSGVVDTMYLSLPQGQAHGVRRTGPVPDRAVLASLAGIYDAGPLALTVTLRADGVLTYAVPGQPAVELRHGNRLHFAPMGDARFSIEFVRNAEGRVTHLISHQVDGDIAARRRGQASETAR
ncbi:MAG: hypothetical protein R2752_22055 [Vicinamibacterales bacterium]